MWFHSNVERFNREFRVQGMKIFRQITFFSLNFAQYPLSFLGLPRNNKNPQLLHNACMRASLSHPFIVLYTFWEQPFIIVTLLFVLWGSSHLASMLKSTGSPTMDGPSESASPLPWLWVIEALAGFKEINTSTLQDLIDVAPVMPDDLCNKTRELVAMRCLEDLFGVDRRIDCDASSSLESRVGFDFSQGCEDVLQQILNEIPLSNLKMAGAELSKWDVFPFIMHKRDSTVKCDLEQLKESIFEGTHPYTDYLKERSGLALQNGGYPVHVNDGECNDLSEKDNGNCTYGANMEAKDNSESVLEDGNKSAKEHLLDKIFLPSKRNRVDSADEYVMGYQHKKEVCMNECDDFLRNAKKIKCYASSNIESKKEMPLSQHGKGVSENSTEKILLVSERGGCQTEKDIRATLGDGSLEDSHDRCTASNQCRSCSHNELFHDESNIPFNATMIPQQPSGVEYCQQQQVESIPTNVALPDEIQHKISGSEPWSKHETDMQLKDPNESQQTVAGDKAKKDTDHDCGAEMSSDIYEYHNEKIDLAAKKHEFLSSQCTFSHDFASTEQTENNLCMKCNEGGQLLVCKTTTCPLMVHESCLGSSAQVDAENNFFCPFCAYCHAFSEYLEAKKKASLARKELAIFIRKDIGPQNTEQLHEFRRKEHSLSRKSSKYAHICDKNNGNDQLAGTEDNKEDIVGEHVSEVNNLLYERSQLQALTSCREKEIVCDGIVEGLYGEEERGEMLNLKSSTGRGVEESQVPAEHVDGNDNFSCEKANIVSVNQSNTEEIQQEMLEQHNTVRTDEPVCAHDTEKEEISEDEHEKPIISRYAMRFRKREMQYKPQAIHQLRRKQIPWTAEEEELIREGVQKFGFGDPKIPWKKILAFGSHVFEKDDKHRTPQDLKNKWKNMCRPHSKSK